MNIENIVEKYLKENDLDGLVLFDRCACKIVDLMPCGEPNIICVGGKIKPCNSSCDDYMGGKCENGWDFCLYECK
jgi:hypothetical protein